MQAHVKEKLDGTRHSDVEQYLKNLYDLYTRQLAYFFYLNLLKWSNSCSCIYVCTLFSHLPQDHSVSH